MREFASIQEFLDFLGTRRSVVLSEQRHGAGEAGEMLAHEAQAKIGHYQVAAGPFPEWELLHEATLNGGVTAQGIPFKGKIELGKAPPDNPLLRYGELRASIEHSSSENEVVIGSHDPVAVFHEFGTEEMAARPVLGPTMFTHGRAAACLVYRFVLAALTGNHRPSVHDLHDDVS